MRHHMPALLRPSCLSPVSRADSLRSDERPVQRPGLARSFAVLSVILAGCSMQPPPDLNAQLKGIDKARFLSCSGPPALEMPQGNQDRMSFVTNLKRGEMIGIMNPAAAPLESCSVDALFENDRLVTATFSGNQGMCDLVFAPCLKK